MSKGIINFQIEEAFKNIGDKDLSDSFVGVFPSNYMNKFINHKMMIYEKKGKYPFLIANTDSSGKEELTGGAYLTLSQKTDIFFFDSLGLNNLKAFIIKDDKKSYRKNFVWN